MLKLWIGRYNESLGKPTGSPDSFFINRMRDFSIIDTDFGHRVLKECSMVEEVYNEHSIKSVLGNYLSPNELSSGAKNLLIMKATDYVCDMLWCGENCHQFVVEISNEKDLVLYSTRWYNPYDYCTGMGKVEILNTGAIVSNGEEFLLDIFADGRDIYPYWKDINLDDED